MSLARRMDVLECRRGSAAMDALVQRSFMILRARAEVDAYRRAMAAFVSDMGSVDGAVGQLEQLGWTVTADLRAAIAATVAA